MRSSGHWLRLSGLGQAFAYGEAHEFDAGVDVQLGHHAFLVAVDGFYAAVELGGDLVA